MHIKRKRSNHEACRLFCCFFAASVSFDLNAHMEEQLSACKASTHQMATNVESQKTCLPWRQWRTQRLRILENCSLDSSVALRKVHVSFGIPPRNSSWVLWTSSCWGGLWTRGPLSWSMPCYTRFSNKEAMQQATTPNFSFCQTFRLKGREMQRKWDIFTPRNGLAHNWDVARA